MAWRFRNKEDCARNSLEIHLGAGMLQQRKARRNRHAIDDQLFRQSLITQGLLPIFFEYRVFAKIA